MFGGPVGSDIMTPVAGKSAEPVSYKLYGVLYHHGESASSGHYTVDVLHSNGDRGSGEGWLHIGDETVSAVQHEDVFGGHGNEWSDDQCAYLLFYRRKDPTRTG
jgi:ubiquitin carboxyl-terminal hydrolase 10